MYAGLLHDLDNYEDLRKSPWRTIQNGTRRSASRNLPSGMVQFRRPKVVRWFHASEANYSSFPVMALLYNI